MLPGVYEFRWDAGHMIFLGIFDLVALVLLGTVTIAVVRALRELRAGRAERLRWSEDWHALPETRRACRHAYDGLMAGRICANGFDCRACITHQALEAAAVATGAAGACGPALTDEALDGLGLPADRLYHRGHTWVRPGDDDTVTIGLDGLAAALVGADLTPEAPASGARLEVNGVAWRLCGRDADVRILSPVEGVVVGGGGRGGGIWLTVRPAGGQLDRRPLLSAAEAAPWMRAEIARLQGCLTDRRLGPCMADGGTLRGDLAAVVPSCDRDAVLGDLFLDP